MALALALALALAIATVQFAADNGQQGGPVTNPPVVTVFRRRCPSTTDPDSVHAGLGDYMEQVGTHCPPLAVALHGRLMRWSSYDAGPADAARLFGALVDAAEDVRKRRRVVSPLACAAIAVFGPDSEAEADALLSRPILVAHNLYAPVGLMFGAFTIGAPQPDRWGRMLAAPPVSFIAIRPTVPAVDTVLLGTGGNGRFGVPTPVDDGRDVLLPVLGVPTSASAARSGFRRLTIRLAAHDRVVSGK